MQCDAENLVRFSPTWGNHEVNREETLAEATSYRSQETETSYYGPSQPQNKQSKTQGAEIASSR